MTDSGFNFDLMQEIIKDEQWEKIPKFYRDKVEALLNKKLVGYFDTIFKTLEKQRNKETKK
ncbi:hypothetical protein VB715_18325 [Crocosphaera sp. UHCC 0190]|uniref:hypothetical protein n=1 Tax=Crocosphaera sp. UHCC 0190 TaxID=3110246 RepID=UPI002B21EB4B|nr:hypothetical protein [Crocosphaera sp. UHCC 0190]MEA5511733.1 hypothetical protein [Crocosphaera sp. UHCC 0190]